MSARARALALLGAATVCAGAAASIVNRYASAVRAQVGPPVSVWVAGRDIPRGKLISAKGAHSYMRRRQVPERFAPPGALRFLGEAYGLRTVTDLPAGTYLTRTQFAERPAVRRGRRSGGDRRRMVEIAVAGASALSAFLQPGTRVDVLITSARDSEPQRTYLALQRLELISFAASGGDRGVDGGPGAGAVAALKVTLRQAVLLTAAQNFATELRLVPRARGDDRLFGPTGFSAADLHL